MQFGSLYTGFFTCEQFTVNLGSWKDSCSPVTKWSVKTLALTDELRETSTIILALMIS